MAKLSDKITIDNIISYGLAGICFKETIQRLDDDGYELLIVPSRGAAPFEHMASQVWYLETQNSPREKRLASNISRIRSLLNSAIYLPFTADITPDISYLETKNIREYWCRVLASIVKGEPSVEYSFYNYIREYVSPDAFRTVFEERAKGKKFVFIDTVISGQAICEINESLLNLGISECHYILFIDEHGARLKEPYNTIIKGLKAEGRATLIEVNSLFTEDVGPAVSGIWTVSYPKLMDVALSEIKPFGNSGAVGAGMYYMEVMRREDGSNEAITVANCILEKMLFSVFLKGCGDLTEIQLESYLEHLEKNKLFNESTTHKIAQSKLKSTMSVSSKLTISGSHTLRLTHSEDEAHKLIKDFKDKNPSFFV